MPGQYSLADAKPIGAFSLAEAKPVEAAPAAPTGTNDLPWYSDPTSGAYHKLMDTVVEHLPVLLGAGGAVLGNVPGAALGGAAGEAYKELINRARGKTNPPTVTDAALKIAAQGAIQGGTQAIGEKVIGPVMASVGERVMQSAVKPSLKILNKTLPGQTPQVVKTLLDEGINVTPGGVQKLHALIDATNDDIKTAIAPYASKEIPALKVAGRLTQTAQKFGAQVNPQADLAAISQVGENFLDHPAVDAAGKITIANAQALKQGTYAQIGSKYGVPNASATIAAEKALARGLKEDIAAEVPDLATLNAREGKLLEALNAVGKRVALAGNRDPVGFAWVTHNPTQFLAALIDRSPAVKSLLARGLYTSAGTAAKVSPQLIRAATVALTTEDADAGLATSTDRGNQ